MSATLAEIAAKVGCQLDGAGETAINRVATLSNATADSISFLANPLYRDQLSATGAAAVVLEARFRDQCPVASLISDNPYASYARIAALLHPPPDVVAGIHPAASVADGADIAASAQIGAQAVIGAGTVIGESVVIGAGSVVGSDVRIDSGSRLAPRVTVLDRVKIGARCVLHSGVVIGSDGFGFAPDAGEWVKVPQLGSVTIGDDVEIGANTTIDRGSIEDTIIEDGVKLDNLVQIAHNAHLGAHTVMAAMSGVAGSTKLGRRCMIAGGVVMIGHLKICDDVLFTFRSVVTKSVSTPGTYGGSLQADDAARWRRNAARFRKLDELADRLRAVEIELAAIPSKQQKKDRSND